MHAGLAVAVLYTDIRHQPSSPLLPQLEPHRLLIEQLMTDHCVTAISTHVQILWNKLGFHPSHILGGQPTDEILKESGHDREQALATIGSGLGCDRCTISLHDKCVGMAGQVLT